MENLFNKIDPLYSTICIKSLEQPSFNTVTSGCNSFVYRGAEEWNLLSDVFTEAVSVESFEFMIPTWNGKQCNCSYCNTCVLERL